MKDTFRYYPVNGQNLIVSDIDLYNLYSDCKQYEAKANAGLELHITYSFVTDHKIEFFSRWLPANTDLILTPPETAVSTLDFIHFVRWSDFDVFKATFADFLTWLL